MIPFSDLEPVGNVGGLSRAPSIAIWRLLLQVFQTALVRPGSVGDMISRSECP